MGEKGTGYVRTAPRICPTPRDLWLNRQPLQKEDHAPYPRICFEIRARLHHWPKLLLKIIIHGSGLCRTPKVRTTNQSSALDGDRTTITRRRHVRVQTTYRGTNASNWSSTRAHHCAQVHVLRLLFFSFLSTNSSTLRDPRCQLPPGNIDISRWG